MTQPDHSESVGCAAKLYADSRCFAKAARSRYILAGELHRAGGRHGDAFARYQQKFGPFVAMKQRAARRFAGAFAPKSTFSLFLRSHVMRLLSIGWIAALAAGREVGDRISLPDY